MKIIVVGDIHGDFQILNHLIETQHPEIILQCGDFGYWPREYGWPPDDPPLRNGKTKIYWCDGNHEDHEDHEDHEELSHIVESNKCEIAPNCFYQPRGSILTLPDGRSVLFFGGAASGDKWRRTEGETWFQSEVPLLSDLDHIQRDATIDIVISHTAPTAFKLWQVPPAGYSRIPWLAKHQEETREILNKILFRYHPQQWYFGHFHIQQTGCNHGCNWTALAMPLEGGETWWVQLPD